MTGTWTWLLLLLDFLLIGKTDFNQDGEFGPECPETQVEAAFGGNVILQCHITKLQRAVDKLEWVWNDRKDVKDVALFRNGRESHKDQAQEYEGRTTLFLSERSKENCSLKLTSVRMSDEGRYRCSVRVGQMEDNCFVYLTVYNNTQHQSPGTGQIKKITPPSKSSSPKGPDANIPDIIVSILGPITFLGIFVIWMIWKKCNRTGTDQPPPDHNNPGDRNVLQPGGVL
uniref:myelin-oligodendrocyte glycoprotein-like isoform X1 n=1 Tax=Scatophagus argus TaxID=75038 RepID=UPI001ED83DE6|nr:myelin-oligodendrocyte glycoprotein-like isoform X1 [Scatophagus argus]